MIRSLGQKVTVKKQIQVTGKFNVVIASVPMPLAGKDITEADSVSFTEQPYTMLNVQLCK
jgi:hypothetical protein